MANYKSMYRYELAEAAGVSVRTLRKWMFNNAQQLKDLGYNISDGILCPGVVKFMCEKYVIILD